MKAFKYLSGIIIVIIIIYSLGPRTEKANYTRALPNIPAHDSMLEKYISSKEGLHKIKPDNEARIIWADKKNKTATEYAIVYLHGFSASQEDGNPVHKNIAQNFGCNLYLARLAEHGIDTVDQLINLTATKYWESAKEAYAIGKKLGKKVILMGTSTGATNALHLAATFPDINALILLSPNIEINNESAWIANNPWGLQLGRRIVGSDYFTPSDTTVMYKKYWNTPYRLEAIAALQEYLESTMQTSTFHKITQPALLLYYYKNQSLQDPVVKVDAMLRMFKELKTPKDQKSSVALPNAGDHVIGSYIKSKDVLGTENAISIFMNSVLHIPAKH